MTLEQGPTYLSEETVGKLFVDVAGNYWRHISYCASPTATIEALTWSDEEPTRRGGEIGSPILDIGLRLLVPEDGS